MFLLQAMRKTNKVSEKAVLQNKFKSCCYHRSLIPYSHFQNRKRSGIPKVFIHKVSSCHLVAKPELHRREATCSLNSSHFMDRVLCFLQKHENP